MPKTTQAKIASDARREANRRNSLRSTGPKTVEGKQRSRMNAAKHGLTGAGIALPTEMAEAVELRFAAVQEELAPTTVLGTFFAFQVALSTVRCERVALQEAAVLAQHVRNAPAALDELRQTQADHLMGWIGCEPVAYRRQLMATPEGCDRLIAGLQTLVDELNKPTITWDYEHSSKLEAYLGRRETDLPRSRGMKLARAIRRDFSELDENELAGLTSDEQRVNYACDQLTEYLEAELQRVQAHRATLNVAGHDLDRAEAGIRALFDSSKEATLARRYEAAAKRDLYRALHEFYVVEATVAPEHEEMLTDIAQPEPNPILRAGDTAEPSTAEPPPDRSKPLPAGALGKTMASIEKRSQGRSEHPKPAPHPANPMPFFASPPGDLGHPRG